MKLVVSTETESLSLVAEHVTRVYADGVAVRIVCGGYTHPLAVKDTARAIWAISDGIVKATTDKVSVHVRPDDDTTIATTETP